MPLTTSTQEELEELAKLMLQDGSSTKPYKNFGTLVRQDSKEFNDFENEIMLGSVEIKGITFVLSNH